MQWLKRATGSKPPLNSLTSYVQQSLKTWLRDPAVLRPHHVNHDCRAFTKAYNLEPCGQFTSEPVYSHCQHLAPASWCMQQQEIFSWPESRLNFNFDVFQFKLYTENDHPPIRYIHENKSRKTIKMVETEYF